MPTSFFKHGDGLRPHNCPTFTPPRRPDCTILVPRHNPMSLVTGDLTQIYNQSSTASDPLNFGSIESENGDACNYSADAGCRLQIC